MRRFITYVFAGASLMFLGANVASAQSAMVMCKDGVKSKGGQGACSSHGGIAPAGETKTEMKSAMKSEKMAAKMDKMTDKKADKKTDKMDSKMAMTADKNAMGATAECKDHTYSHSKTHAGSCSSHGGVAKFLDKP